MRFVVFGLTVSSSWGNGHATLWRGLARALGRRGHRLAFFERDVPYYATHRDLHALDGGALHLYARFEDAVPAARRELREADCAVVTSYCPDALAATELVLGSHAAVRAFYDLDTPVTLARRDAGERVEWLGPRGLADFDLALSFTGGGALRLLRDGLGAPRAAALYGSVDPEVHRPAAPQERLRGDLSYLGTFDPSRQAALDRLFLEPARRRPRQAFVLAGALYGADFPWRENVRYVHHLPPAEHAAFFASSPLTVNATRAAMAALGHCPSGRLFEAAACGTPVLSDAWDGLAAFFEPGREILVARTTEEALAALDLGPDRLAAVGRAARARALAQHTAERRAEELVAAVAAAAGGD